MARFPLTHDEKDVKITATHQHVPDETLRLFLHGVLAEANAQGYGVYAKGRLFTLALRTWEGR